MHLDTTMLIDMVLLPFRPHHDGALRAWHGDTGRQAWWPVRHVQRHGGEQEGAGASLAGLQLGCTVQQCLEHLAGVVQHRVVGQHLA